MHPHHSVSARLPAHDLSRIALAVDALTAGTSCPCLVHVDFGPDPFDHAAIVEFGLTPLPGASGFHDVLSALDGWCAPVAWYVVGVSTPASVRSTEAIGRHHPAWVVHLVDRGGERMTRLSVPDAPRLSGSTSGFLSDTPLDCCLRRVLGMPG